ncbi:CRISPR-associated ring nuclease Csm6 [Azotobacter armeniacus]
MQSILLAVTGMSPQVITETLYAIHREGLPWPSRIELITTRIGAAKARQGLLEHGHLARLCNELRRPLPVLDERQSWVVSTPDGQPVDDARNLEDHEALADFILARVRDLTADPRSSLHASLAGGRKTMTFYLGYAMSLFGRAQDKLSHVLVSPSFEGHPDFYYPSREQAAIRLPDGSRLEPAQAQVELADIPFIRHRHSLPGLLQEVGTEIRFRDLVRLINLGDQPELLHLHLDLQAARVTVTDELGQTLAAIEPGLLELAFYALCVRATLEGHKDITRPAHRTPCTGLLKCLLDELLPLCGLPAGGSTADQFAVLEDWNELHGRFKDSTLSAIADGIPARWFDQRKNTLQSSFERRLPGSITRWLLPEIIWSETGERLQPGNRVPGGGYGIPLCEGQIRISEAASFETR